MKKIPQCEKTLSCDSEGDIKQHSSQLATQHKAKIPKIVILIGIVFGILVIGGITTYLFLKKDSKDTQKSSEETDKEITGQAKDTSLPSEGDTLLQTICQTAINDYPEWTTSTGIVVWENLSKEIPNFFYRESCEATAVSLTSPAGDNEQLVDLDLLDTDKLAYTKASQDKWEIGVMDFSSSTGSSTIYSKTEVISILDISFINHDEFLILYATDSKTTLKYIKKTSGTEETLMELDSSSINKDMGRNTKKVAVSPKGTYAYMLDSALEGNSGALKIFDLSSKEQIDEIELGIYPVWIGDTHILYSSQAEDSGVFLYDVESGDKYEVSKIDSNAVDLNFNPESEGMISYNKDSKADNAEGFIISCQDFKTIASFQNGIIEAFTDKETAILTSSTSGLTGTGFWRFDAAWTVLLSEELGSYSSRAAIATVWSRY